MVRFIASVSGEVGVTAVVLGVDLTGRTPGARRPVRRVVAQGGCVLSEYEDDAPPRPWRFPQRNRLISAFSCSHGGPGG